MTAAGVHARLALLNRLVGPADGWPDLAAALHEVAQAFDLKSVGLRWPAQGAAVVFAESSPGGTARLRFPVPAEGLDDGLLWADGTEDEAEFLRLVANVIGNSPLFRRLLGAMGEQPRIAQRLADAGRVAGRVAHDMDNVFQGVTGFTALALEQLRPGSPPHKNLGEVKAAADQGLRFTAQLHQLSRGGNARPFPTLVPSAVAREIARVAEGHPSLRFEVEVPASLPAVPMEAGLLQGLVGSLIDNAAEASPPDGVVGVMARVVELGPADLTTLLGAPDIGPHVELTIRDRGPGMTEEARRKMFVEPFFTTKMRHRGLGLSVAYRTIHAHRGGVRADGPAGQGTTIRLVLPLAVARVPATKPAALLEVP